VPYLQYLPELTLVLPLLDGRHLDAGPFRPAVEVSTSKRSLPLPQFLRLSTSLWRCLLRHPQVLDLRLAARGLPAAPDAVMALLFLPQRRGFAPITSSTAEGLALRVKGHAGMATRKPVHLRLYPECVPSRRNRARYRLGRQIEDGARVARVVKPPALSRSSAR